ncbi:MAG: hypothetical protein ABIH87_00455 [bacterium]
MNLICPECKNQVDLSNYPDLAVDHVVECNFCGITLQVLDIDGNNVEADVIDEGK